MIITGTTTCDCEKQVADNNDINQTNTAQKTTFKEKANDNIFTLNNFFSRKEQKSTSSSKFALNNISRIPAGFLTNIFQPPKALAFSSLFIAHKFFVPIAAIVNIR